MAEQVHGRPDDDRSSGGYFEKWDKFAKDEEEAIKNEVKAEEEKASAALGLNPNAPRSQVQVEEQRKREALKVSLASRATSQQTKQSHPIPRFAPSDMFPALFIHRAGCPVLPFLRHPRCSRNPGSPTEHLPRSRLPWMDRTRPSRLPE